MNANIEILNYLNLINKRLGKQYQVTGYNPLPKDFILDKDKIKERLFLGQMNDPVLFQRFVYKDKKEIKKILKISQKNTKNLLKDIFKKSLSTEFDKKLSLYLTFRYEIINMILKEFKNYDFNEFIAFEEIYAIDPIFGEIFESIFEKEFNFYSLDNVEDKYKLSYLEKIKILEKKNKKERQLSTPKTITKKPFTKEKSIKNIEKIKKKSKIIEKTIKSGGFLKSTNKEKE